MSLCLFNCSVVLLLYAVRNPLDGIQCCSQLRVASIFTHIQNNWTQYLFPAGHANITSWICTQGISNWIAGSALLAADILLNCQML